MTKETVTEEEIVEIIGFLILSIVTEKVNGLRTISELLPHIEQSIKRYSEGKITFKTPVKVAGIVKGNVKSIL